MATLDHDRRNKQPRLLQPAERDKLEEFVDAIHYSSRYSDDENEYRHVQLPKEMIKKIPQEYFDPSKGTLKLLWEEEWRGLGITQVRTTAHQYRDLEQQLIARVVEFGMGALRSP
ncbi:MAG: Cyclin-dependent kinases regulatory subunit (Cell division control protein cks1) [Alectoria fallacina]|uniref:Cyclin-dependent kinases regulatory subunit n=1 Tax=Alectoria fallacina TaxID=1903189 RepID=A0A8H3G641_9LECA|nr:MAG: Cyclin-dependent kinases regulatory subunit (Cell division control protein cks1) [Alectoria fallacina]